MNQKRIFKLIIAVIIILALFSFLHSPYFRLRDIKITGIRVLEKEELKSSLNQYLGTNLWLLDNSKIIKKFIDSRYIKDLTINKKYPDLIEININERTPLAKINNKGKYLVFNINGYILEEGPLKTKASVPLIEGIGYSFDSNDNLALTPLLKEICRGLIEMKSTSLAQLSLIKKKNDKNIIVKLNNNVIVYLGQASQLKRKFKILSSLIEKIQKEDLKVEYIKLQQVQKPVIKLK